MNSRTLPIAEGNKYYIANNYGDWELIGVEPHNKTTLTIYGKEN